MSLASPMLAHGPKRTADGELKGETTVVDSPVPAGRGHKRTKSESGSKIGEVRIRMSSVWLFLVANSCVAFRATQDSVIICNDEGAERLGETITRGT
jgi:hypothetical protein